MVRLLVADAQCIVRMGIKELCRDMGGFSVEGEAANGDEALEALSAASYDMVVLDPCLPGQRLANGSSTGGINLINAIRVRHANLPILAFSTNDDPETINRILGTGVAGFLAKNSDREALETAMRKVAGGQNFVSAEIAIKIMFGKFIGHEDAPQQNLTRRESQVMRLLGQGKSLNTIADELFISSRTVSTHKMRLMQKMGFKSNAELFHYALELGKAAPAAGDLAYADERIEIAPPPHCNATDTEPDLMEGA